MPLGLGSGFWAVVLPSEKTNLCTNPSFEYGTQGWGTLQAGTIGTTSSLQQYGAWSGSIAPTSNGTTGAISPTFTATNGVAYTFSAYVRGANGIPYKLGVGDSNGVNLVGSTNFTGGGTWQLVVGSWTEASGATRRLVLQKNASADTSAFYIDGVQIESGSLTTYIDGDQPGGTWTGAVQNSTSTRSGQYRGGGSVVALADLGWQVDQMPGVGVPPLENSSQSYAVLDGAQYQRTRAATRQFTLTAKPVVGTTTADFHVTRRTIYDALKIDLVTPQQPVRLVYVGAQGTQTLDAYYDSGLELGNMDGPMAEDFAAKFQAYDPYWYAPTNQGTTLAANTALGSANFIVKRSPLGVWGTLGANGSTVSDTAQPALVTIKALTMNAGGTLFLGGYFGTLAGTWANGIGMYYPASNTFGTLTGGTIGNGGATPEVRALQFSPAGSLFIAGNTLTHGGTTSPNVGFWNGVFGTLTGGTVDVNNQGYTLLYSPTGTLFLGGNFLNAGGTTAPRIAMWANAVWGTLSQTSGTSTGRVDTLAWALDNSLYAGGIFDKIGGTAAGSVARWNGAWGTLSSGASGGGVSDLGVKPDGRIVAGGDFVTMGGVTANGVAEWNGAGWTPDSTGVAGGVRTVGVRQNNSFIVAGSFTSAGGISTPDPIALWTGAAYQPIGIDLPATPIIYSIFEAPDQTLYMAGVFSGTATAATAATVVNAGRAQAYPIVRFRNTSSGTARLYYLVNFTTGAGLYFNLSLLAGEIATLNLTPGNRSFTTTFRFNVFGNILPSSNLATWSLLPGTNNLSYYADNGSLETSIYWVPRGWSADSGTVY